MPTSSLLLRARFSLLMATPLILFTAITTIYFRPGKAEAWNIVNVNRGHTGFVVLPDSSIANLNAGSSLKVSTDYKKTPVMYLDGEGHFKLNGRSDQKTVLKTSIAEITAGQNTFNVSTYEDNLSIACLDGALAIKTKDGHQLRINPGIALNYNFDNKSWSTVNIDKDTVTSWLYGVYYLNEEKLEDICKRIERVYNVRIRFDCVRCTQHRFSGFFKKTEPIGVILGNLSLAGRIGYFYDSRGVIHWR
jgi:ferric-dicitrate binding protein FerR (iron transport regulator)